MLCSYYNRNDGDIQGGIIYYIFDENNDLDSVNWMLNILYQLNSNIPVYLFFVHIFHY